MARKRNMDISDVTKGRGRSGVNYDAVKSRMYASYIT